MSARKFQMHLLNDGVIKVDGGALFGQVPKVFWEGLMKPDRRNRIRLNLNCLLIQSPEGNVLVDTGVGSKFDDETKEIYGLNSSALRKSLRDIGAGPADIDYVVPIHLQFHHAGGGTRINRRGEAVPAFPRAKYLIQEAAWEEATHPNERTQAFFNQDDFLPLQKQGQVELLQGDQEVVPGVTIKTVVGPSRGHQMVLINYSGHRVAFLGDLVPTPYHLTLSCISAYDQYPEESLENKRDVLAMMEREGWLMVFPRGDGNRAGYLERRNGRLSLKPVEM